MLAAWKQRARALKTEIYALYVAYRDPRTPWHARLVALCVVGYAFSPIDLVPDFIPVLGYLDDLILLPLGIRLAMRLIPPHVLADSRIAAARAMQEGRPVNRVAAAIIIGIWLAIAALGIAWLRA